MTTRSITGPMKLDGHTMDISTNGSKTLLIFSSSGHFDGSSTSTLDPDKVSTVYLTVGAVTIKSISYSLSSLS